VNLGNPDEHTVLELAHTIVELTGSSSTIAHHPLPEDDPTRRRPDISLASELLGWQPTTPLDEGLRRTAKYLADRVRPAGS
jgi:nucleoside-diphosphate-sugar epimerase